MVGVVGRRAFHIFDKIKCRWICSTRTLAYEKLADGLKPEMEEDETIEV